MFADFGDESWEGNQKLSNGFVRSLPVLIGHKASVAGSVVRKKICRASGCSMSRHGRAVNFGKFAN